MERRGFRKVLLGQMLAEKQDEWIKSSIFNTTSIFSEIWSMKKALVFRRSQGFVGFSQNLRGSTCFSVYTHWRILIVHPLYFLLIQKKISSRRCTVFLFLIGGQPENI